MELNAPSSDLSFPCFGSLLIALDKHAEGHEEHTGDEEEARWRGGCRWRGIGEVGEVVERTNTWLGSESNYCLARA